MTAGAPRTVSPSPEEMIALGEEMLKWVKLNDPLHLSEWYKIEKMIIYKVWKTYIQREEFIPYYEKALAIIGRKYLDKNSDVRDGISNRWQRVYFKDLKDDEDQDVQEKLDRELDHKKKVIEHDALQKMQTASPIAPNDEVNSLKFENMQIKGERDELRKQCLRDKPDAEQKLSGSDTSL